MRLHNNGAMAMRKGYCIGGPIHGQVMNVKHGASMVHAPTLSRYGWVDGQWIYQGPAEGMVAGNPSAAAAPSAPPYIVVKTGN